MLLFLKPHCKTQFVDIEKKFSASKLRIRSSRDERSGSIGLLERQDLLDIYFSDLMSRMKKWSG